MPVIRVDEYVSETGKTIAHWDFKSTNDAVIYIQRLNMHSAKPRLFMKRDATQEEIKTEIERLNAEITRLKINTEEATNNFYRLEPLFSALDWYKENLMEDETVPEQIKVWLVSNVGDTYHFFDRKKADEHIIKGGGNLSSGEYWVREATPKEIRGFIEVLERELDEVQEGSPARDTDWYKEEIDRLAKYKMSIAGTYSQDETMTEETMTEESMELLHKAITDNYEKIRTVALIKEKFEIDSVNNVYTNMHHGNVTKIKATLTGDELLLLMKFLQGDM